MRLTTSRLVICSLILLFTTRFNVAGQKNAIGFYGTVNDYVGDINNNKFQLFKTKYFKPGIAMKLEQYLSPFFNAEETFAYDWVQYQTDNKLAGVDAQFLSLDFRFKYKFDNDFNIRSTSPIKPFIDFGVGGNYFKSREFIKDKSGKQISEDAKFHLVLGGGITFRINEKLSFEIGSRAYMPLYDLWDGIGKEGTDIWTNDLHVQHSAGFVFALQKSLDSDKDGVPDKRDKCPNTPRGMKVNAVGCPNDRDNDGIPDYEDRCPDQAGPKMFNGCPDRDNDYIPDIDDACPSIYGLAKNRGCPDSNTPQNKETNTDGDSDGDGVPDSRDKCPNTPRGTTVNADGCPIQKEEDNTDTDGDGVPDRIDKCPTKFGPKSNRGCPEVKPEIKKRLKFATRGIYFETGKAILKPESYPMLDEVVDIINQYPDYDLRMAGHTDNVGGDQYNLQLSQNRVDAVKNYLINKGIAAGRLDATGYGKTKPIATNATPIGRALNRRVELELYLK